jgi:hypothetical protein
MDYTYLTNLKSDFHSQLFPILASSIYYKLKGMYKYSEELHLKIQKKRNMSLDDVFKKVISGFETLNNHEIEKQYVMIKMKSDCADFFDNLVTASFKSYILFITWDPETQTSKYSDNDFYKQISIKDFIHKCHIVAAGYFIEHYEMFASKNKKDIIDIISSCIKIAMTKMIPYDEMLNEYIENNFSAKIGNNAGELLKIKGLVNNFISNRKYGENIPQQNVIANEQNNFVTDYSDDVNDVENFIQNQHQHRESVLDENDDEPEQSESTIVTYISRDESKDKKINEMIGGDTSENDEGSNNNAEDENEESEAEVETGPESGSGSKSNNESNKKIKLTEPPAMKGRNKLADLGIKNKVKIVSNKKGTSGKVKEMDEFFQKQLHA